MSALANLANEVSAKFRNRGERKGCWLTNLALQHLGSLKLTSFPFTVY